MPNPIAFLAAVEKRIEGIVDPSADLSAIADCAEGLGFSRPDMAALRGLLRLSSDGDLAPRPSIYNDSIGRMLAQLPAAGAPPACLAAHDALLTDDYDWPVNKLLNFALARRTVPDRAVALVASVKNEGLGLLEWVAYHLVIGIERIFLYSNDNDDGSNALIKALDAAGYIVAIENTSSGKVPPQSKAYEHALNLLPELRRFRWAFFLDADEFLVSHAEPEFDVHTLLTIIEEKSAEQPIDAVMFNWKWFGSENAFARTPGLVLDRFVHSKPDTHIKTLVRLSNTTSMRHLHCPVMISPERIVRSDLSRPDTDEHRSGRTSPVYKLGQINHYWNKSFEEFLVKKYRGRGAILLGGPERSFRSFFEWGGNGSRGAFDPPSDIVLRKTRLLIETLGEHSDIQIALSEIERQFVIRMQGLEAANDIKGLYKSRGVLTDSAITQQKSLASADHSDERGNTPSDPSG